MTNRRSRVAIAAAAVATLACLPAMALEDIDLYAGGDSLAPNVLFFIDNSSNWSANNNAWKYSDVYGKCTTKYGTDTKILAICQKYVNDVFDNGNTASLVQGQIELRALRLVLNEVYCNVTKTEDRLNFNAGLMLYNTKGTVDGDNVNGGYIRHAIKPLSDTLCKGTEPQSHPPLLADLAQIDSKITNDDFKGPSSTDYGTALYEAFKYFGGWTQPKYKPGSSLGGSTGVAGTPADSTGYGPNRYASANPLEDGAAFSDPSAKKIYKSPIDDLNACGHNYIIVIGNQWPNQEFGTNQNATPPTNTLMTRLGYQPDKQLYTVSNKSDIRFADEWAEFLFKTDVNKAAGVQNVKTFTINVFNAAADAKQTKLLQEMAKAGLGTSNYQEGYFEVGGDLFALINALKDILAQISAVDSVFTSASLPVSVNAQGTYLNQVFMGVFRPDDDGQQRWAGNLKQYKFGLNTDKSLFLADATGKSAVDSANTGFIQHCATSFWTTDSGNYWEKITGTSGGCLTAGLSAYSDMPDGPLVERGGVAQKLRNMAPADRNIRTCTSKTNCSSLVDFNSTQITSMTGVASTDVATVVDWVRGKNSGDGTTNFSGVTSWNKYDTANSSGVALTATSTRPTVHGDVIHSTPLAVNYGTSTTNDVVVFYGAGDGTLRAIDGSQTTSVSSTAGQELWSFIAPEHWDSAFTDSKGVQRNLLDRVRTNSPLVAFANFATMTTITPTPTPKTYFFDGSITGYQDASGDALTKLWIYATMRRGGNMVYAFDVSKKPSKTNQPAMLWRFGCATEGTDCAGTSTGESKMGQSWSAPIVIRVQGMADPLVIFGGGYHSCEDALADSNPCSTKDIGKGIYVMSAEKGSGQHYRFFSPSSADTVTGLFTADMTAVDANGDGYTDLVYAADTRGNLWRLNTSNPSTFVGYGSVDEWPAPVLIARASLWGTSSTVTDRRKFMYGPSVVITSKTQALVLIGTGDREKPTSKTEVDAPQIKNRFYGIKDNFTLTSSVPVVAGYGSAPAELLNVTGASSVSLTDLAVKRGWFMDLFTTTQPYEQVVTTPLTIGGVTYFNTYQAAGEGSTCSNLGTARGYAVDFQTGVQQKNDLGELAPMEYLSQGIPPPPRGGTVDVDGETVTFCISCAGEKSILDPEEPIVKLRPSRKPVYRYQRIDKQ